jgi:hypothetical protein
MSSVYLVGRLAALEKAKQEMADIQEEIVTSLTHNCTVQGLLIQFLTDTNLTGSELTNELEKRLSYYNQLHETNRFLRS